MSKWIKEAVPAGMFVLALLFMGYLAGSLTTLSDTFPSHYVRHAYHAADSLRLKHAYSQDSYKTNLWTHARTQERGVTVHAAGRSQPGLTLYTSGHAATALLMDLNGRTVHEWRRPFRDVWDETSPVRDPVPEPQIYFRKAQALPNGDLLAIYIGVGDTPWGYGMVRLDRDSNVLWKNLERFHHDFALAEDGRIFALTHAFRSQPVDGHDHLRPPLLDDFLTVLSADGETEKRISLLDAVQRSRYGRDLFRVFHFTLWDPLHTNSVDILDEAAASALRAKVPVAAPGQMLLSFRELDGGTIALLDVEQEVIVWALSGSWKSQHDPDILPNGNILMFDNLGDFSPGGESRVIEVDPGHGGVVWSYDGTAENRLRSYWRSAQEPQPNGNVLITESVGARLLEVDRNGEIVWEFVNPVRAQRNPDMTPVVSWASRLDPQALEPEFRAMVLDSPPAT